MAISIETMTDKIQFLDRYAPVMNQEAILRIWRNQPMMVYGAQEDGEPIGALCAVKAPDNNVEIVFLYVEETYRRIGIARGMVQQLYWDGLSQPELSSIRVTFALLSEEQMVAMEGLFKECLFVEELPMEGERHWEFPLTAISVPKIKPRKDILSFDALMDCHRSEILTQMDEKVLPPTTANHLSYALVDGQTVKSFLWVEQLQPKVYRIAMMYNTGATKDLIALMTTAMDAAHRYAFADDLMLVEIYDNHGFDLLQKLTTIDMIPSRRFVTMVNRLF